MDKTILDVHVLTSTLSLVMLCCIGHLKIPLFSAFFFPPLSYMAPNTNLLCSANKDCTCGNYLTEHLLCFLQAVWQTFLL